MTRTLEVVPKMSNPYGKHVGWKINSTSGPSPAQVFDKKKTAVKEAKKMAKQDARQHGHSVGLKIFAKDGEYQRQHVYEP